FAGKSQRIRRRLQECHSRRFGTNQRRPIKKDKPLQEDGFKYIHLEVQKLREHWIKVFWNMSKGNKTIMDSLRRTNHVEFWYLLDEFEAEIDKNNKRSK